MNTTLYHTGIDTVVTTLPTYTLGTGFENLRYAGSSNFTGTGNNAANLIDGAGGNDHLHGGAGNDVLDGLTVIREAIGSQVTREPTRSCSA